MVPAQARVLVVSPDRGAQRTLRETLAGHGYTLDGVRTAEQARSRLSNDEFELVLCDVHLEGESGLALTQHISDSHPDLAVLLITEVDDDPTIVGRAMDSGAVGYLIEPFEPHEVILAASNALRRREFDLQYRTRSQMLESAAKERLQGARELLQRRREEGGLEAEDPWLGLAADPHRAVAGDEVTQRLLALARNVARTSSTVLLLGESGSGKEVVARHIHRHSERAAAPFIAVNCAAFPASLLESELFGHEKGAFSGAVQRHRGVFERAKGGTLLLDEISEIPADMQAKLLRVLQERLLIRVGGTQTVDLDIRVIATTNRDLKQSVRNGTFRLDLYYRLNVFPLTVPPLRHRPKDIRPLTEYFLAKIARESGQPVKGIRESAMAFLQAYRFPGNVRELLNILERAAILAHDSPMVNAEHIMLESTLGDSGVHPAIDGTEQDGFYVRPGTEPLADIERRVILGTLTRFNGNRTRTAKALGVSLRTVRNKIRTYREQGIFIPSR